MVAALVSGSQPSALVNSSVATLSLRAGTSDADATRARLSPSRSTRVKVLEYVVRAKPWRLSGPQSPRSRRKECPSLFAQTTPFAVRPHSACRCPGRRGEWSMTDCSNRGRLVQGVSAPKRPWPSPVAQTNPVAARARPAPHRRVTSSTCGRCACHAPCVTRCGASLPSPGSKGAPSHRKQS